MPPPPDHTPDTYRSIAAPCTAEFKDKGSRFIAYAEPISNPESLRDALERIRQLHPKATHHCYAYRLGFDKQANYRANDDGEPAGSAGRPILGQIDSKNLTQILVVVVRYFGGTKLGVPGLIAAYKTATAMALEAADIVSVAVYCAYELRFSYLQMNEVMQCLKRENGRTSQQNFDHTCTLRYALPKADSPRLLDRLTNIEGLDINYLGLE